MMRRARSLVDLALAALCLWAAWYHTPPGALLRTVAARVLHARTSARPLLSYYGAGALAPDSLPQAPAPHAPLAPGAALGLGAWAVLEGLPAAERAQVVAGAGLSAPSPEALAAHLLHESAQLGSREAAVLALFCGSEAARYARGRALGTDLEDLARELPPRYEGRVALAAQALTLGTAYALAWPLPEAIRVTSPFGPREHPMLSGRRLHSGVDLGVPIGTPVRAVADGIVRRASSDSVSGQLVLVDHGSGVSTIYCHNDELLVSEGDRVEKGQVIARSGNTGRSTGPHLHYQLDLPQGPVDPFRFRGARPVHVALGATEP